MNIGAYTFDEFKTLAENFHGYAAPGLLIGGYMVEMAKARLPQGTLFEAVVESGKCLPDAVQLLTLCSIGNNWMKIHNLGRYAVSLFDKHTGEGVRVSLDVNKLNAFPEIKSWFLKQKVKSQQDTNALLDQIEAAGDSICAVAPITMKRRFLGHSHMEHIGICPLCGEAYPTEDGSLCRGCQGEAPYVTAERVIKPRAISKHETNGHSMAADTTTAQATSAKTFPVRVVPVEEAVGKQAAHDMTRIEPGVFKGPEFKAGQRITVGDICRLQQMGRFHVAVHDEADALEHIVHENQAAEAFAKRMAGSGIGYELPPREGKIDFTALNDGLFCVDVLRLAAFNRLPDIMAATRQDAALVNKGSKLAGTRAIPLYITRERLGEALAVLGHEPLFSVLPLRRAKVGILVTGTEVFQGIIEDKFIPVITAKAEQYTCSVVKSIIVPDDKERIAQGVAAIREAGADLLVTTGGLSVDPDDVTRQALLNAGLTDVLHGVPVLPGTMSLMGNMPGKEGATIQVLGVPACALYYKTTFLDLILPRMLAGREITRTELSRLGDGGFCLGCKICTYPKCQFGK